MWVLYAGYLYIYHVTAIPANSHIALNSTGTGSPGNQTDASVEPTWQDSPTTRGTMNLLLSCGVTIALAVWSSVLVNIQMSPDETLPSPSRADPNDDKVNTSWERRWRAFRQYILLALDPRHRVRWKYKVLWATLNVVVPELALAIAVGEWRTAKDVTNALNKITCGGLFEKWDMSMGYYAVMGGFYVPNVPDPVHHQASTENEGNGSQNHDASFNCSCVTLVDRCCAVSARRVEHLREKMDFKRSWVGQHGSSRQIEMEKAALMARKPRQVLTTHGVLFMARLIDDLRECPEAADNAPPDAACKYRNPRAQSQGCNCIQHAARLEKQFRDITPEIVRDLSKADWVGRLVFIVQANWMIIQTVARSSAKPQLPITLLELHAAAHVALAVVQYLIWWSKPHDLIVMTPLSLPYEDFPMPKTEDLTNHYLLDDDYPLLLEKIPTEHTPEQRMFPPPSTRKQSQSSQGSETHWNRYNLPLEPENSHTERWTFRMLQLQDWWTGLLEVDDSGQLSNGYFTSQATLGKSVSQQIAGISVPHNPLRGTVLAIVRLTLGWHRWPKEASVWFTTILFYNAIHLVAWSWHFPTHVEQMLWRWSTASTTASTSITISLVLLASLYRGLRIQGVKWQKSREKDPTSSNWFRRLFVGFACSDHLLWLYRQATRIVALTSAAYMILVVAARGFIFVESIISIRRVQKGTYTNVEWTRVIPHL